MKICAYVQERYAKQSYSNECFDVRVFAGMSVVIDILRRGGRSVEFAGAATVHQYDIVLVSLASDCDWWDFIAERIKWRKGTYRVIVGGFGALNVRPFLQWVDYLVLGRAEGVIDVLIDHLAQGDADEIPSVIKSKTFSPDRVYRLNQVPEIYPHDIVLESGKTYHEDTLGCNHRCLFCGYTWYRKSVQKEAFSYSGLWDGNTDRERAMLDIANGVNIDLMRLRTTAIDGMSERLRRMVNKPITRDMLRGFLCQLVECGKPHQVKFYNILGYPTETEDDWLEFAEDLRIADSKYTKRDKQVSVLLHSTPFRAMPATPMACMPMSYRNYRGAVAKTLKSPGMKGNVFFQGEAMWAVEGFGTDSLPTVFQSAIVHRGVESDADNFAKIALSRKFATANAATKIATLERYFDAAALFGEFTPDTLPTRYLRTYAAVERRWGLPGKQ